MIQIDYSAALHAAFDMARKKLYDIDVDYFEGITRDCETLPEGLDLQLRDRVVESFSREVREIFSNENIHAIATRGLDGPVPKMDVEAIARAKQESAKALASRLTREAPDFDVARYTDDDLRALYESALRRGVIERIRRSNKADIMDFHRALMDSTACACKRVFRDILKDIVML